MTNNHLVSIIMPAYNADKYIADAIQSVLQQSYPNWELIVVNDGSEDGTEKIILGIHDGRIRYYKQKNKGVSAARNLGLKKMRGAFFCFLDADDVMPENSIRSRVEKFNTDGKLQFVDGWVDVKSLDLKLTLRFYKPRFKGNPFAKLIQLSDECYVGLSWMIKKVQEKEYMFCEDMTHAEDLMFLISIAEGGLYTYVEEPVLWYRTGGSSAMANLKGLEEGYFKLYQKIMKVRGIENKTLILLRRRICRIMVFSYVKKMMLFDAVRCIFRCLLLK